METHLESLSKEELVDILNLAKSVIPSFRDLLKMEDGERKDAAVLATVQAAFLYSVVEMIPPHYEEKYISHLVDMLRDGFELRKGMNPEVTQKPEDSV